MAKFQPTNQDNSCPVCEKTNGNCRILPDDGILCMSFADKFSGQNHPDYRYTKSTKDRLWGIYYPRTDNDFNRENWERETAERQRERDRYREARSQAALLLEVRDRDIKAILGQLTLNETDRQRLNRRGLTDAQINKIGYVSVKKWQPLTGILSYGVNRKGNLNNPWDGILCPIRNRKGQLIALRLHNPNRRPKYLSFKGSNLKSGEFPIAVYGQNLASGIVGITEGLEFKPAITSYRLGIPVIGHNGTTFTSSPLQSQATLEDLGASIIRLYPDGGVVGNPGLVAQYQKAIALYQSWGYLVEIAWWGQFTKADGDIDEINESKINSIVYLDPQTFFEIASKEQWRQQVGKEQKKLNNLSYKHDILITQKYFPSLDELQKIKALPNTGIFNLLGHKGSGKSTLTKQIKDYYRSEGYQVISITPRIALGREQAFKCGIEWLGDIGADKVELNLIAENTAQLGLCFDSIHRIAARDFTEKTLLIFDESELGFNHLATSQTLKDRRSFVLKTLENIIKDCLNNNGLIILSDADLTDVSVDYIKSLCPDTPIFTVVNEAKPQSWEVDFYTDGQTGADVKTAIFDDIENGLRLIIPVDNQGEAEALDRELSKRFPDKKIIRIDRTTTETEAGRKFVEQINLSILNEKPDVLIHTGSMGTGCSIDGEHYDKELEKTLCFPEVYHWFDKVYGLFFGVIEPSQCRQYLARYRKPVPRIIWAKESGFKDDSCKSFLPDVIKRNLFKNSEQTLNIIELAKELAGGDDADDIAVLDTLNGMMNRESGTWDNPHIDLYCQVKARRNYGLSQLAIQLRQELIEEGHTVKDYISESSNPISDSIKATKQEIKVEQATAIATAPDIPLEQAKWINRQATTTEDERNQATKAFLKAELPGLELTSNFIFNWIIKDRRKELNAVKLFFFCQNPDIAKYQDNKEWRAKLKQFSNGTAFLPDIKTYSPMVKVLNDLGYFDLIDIHDPGREYRGTDGDVVNFMQRAYFMRHRIYTAFGLTVTKKTDPINFISRLSKRIGIYFKKNQYKIEGVFIRTYQINTENLNDPTRKMILESLIRRYAEIHTEQDFDRDHNFSVSLKNKREVVQPQNQDNQNEKGNTFSPDMAPMDTDNDPFTNYQEGDRVLLWHPFSQQWQPATIQRVVSGFNGFIHALGDNGLGDSITRHKLSQLAPLVNHEAA